MGYMSLKMTVQFRSHISLLCYDWASSGMHKQILRRPKQNSGIIDQYSWKSMCMHVSPSYLGCFVNMTFDPHSGSGGLLCEYDL